MLRLPVVHPELLAALGRTGHGSTVLIADGNYPYVTGARPEAERINLNFASGILTVSQVLTGVAEILPIEFARVMAPGEEGDTPLLATYRKILGLELQLVERFAFYETARERDLSLVIATGDRQHYANVLLTVGVMPSVA